MASYVANHVHVICRYFTHPWVSPYGPAFGCSNLIRSNLSGLHSQHKFIPDEFVFACPKKSNQKKRHPGQFALRVPSPFAFAYGPSWLAVRARQD